MDRKKHGPRLKQYWQGERPPELSVEEKNQCEPNSDAPRLTRSRGHSAAMVGRPVHHGELAHLNFIRLDHRPGLWLCAVVDAASGVIGGTKVVTVKSVNVAAGVIREYIEKHGRPWAFCVDAEARLTIEGERLSEVLAELDIVLVERRAVMAKGQVERLFQGLQESLAVTPGTDPDDIERHVWNIVAAYNRAVGLSGGAFGPDIHRSIENYETELAALVEISVDLAGDLVN